MFISKCATPPLSTLVHTIINLVQRICEPSRTRQIGWYNKDMSKDEEEFPRWQRWLTIIVMVAVVIATVIVDFLVLPGAR